MGPVFCLSASGLRFGPGLRGYESHCMLCRECSESPMSCTPLDAALVLWRVAEAGTGCACPHLIPRLGELQKRQDPPGLPNGSAAADHSAAQRTSIEVQDGKSQHT